MAPAMAYANEHLCVAQETQSNNELNAVKKHKHTRSHQGARQDMINKSCKANSGSKVPQLEMCKCTLLTIHVSSMNRKNPCSVLQFPPH